MTDSKSSTSSPTSRVTVRRPVDLSDFSDADRKYLAKVAYSYIQNPADIEDTIQRTLLKALQANFDGRCAKRSWLIGILVSECLMFLRSRKQKLNFALSHAVDSESLTVASREPSALTVMLRAEKSERVQKQVKCLPRRYGQILTMHYFGERPLHETAIELGISLGATKSYASRGRKILKAKLEEIG